LYIEKSQKFITDVLNVDSIPMYAAVLGTEHTIEQLDQVPTTPVRLADEALTAVPAIS
jgi:uncharacterized protein (DUF849 family)